MISWVAPVNPSHPYLENDPAPSFDPRHLRISPWLYLGCHPREAGAGRVSEDPVPVGVEGEVCRDAAPGPGGIRK